MENRAGGRLLKSFRHDEETRCTSYQGDRRRVNQIHAIARFSAVLVRPTDGLCHAFLARESTGSEF